VALAASAVAKYCTWTPAYIPYLILTMVPISLRLLAEGGLVYTILGLMGFVFTAILAQTGVIMHAASWRALAVGIRNEALSSFLSEEKAKEERLNAQLQQEITERTRSQEELLLQNQELERLNTQLTTTKDNLESANEKLERALISIKQLSGMIPICASCKKIRNDEGYWEQIEAYIRDHSEAEFSHSICPECAERLYPGFFHKT
jgi:septal ring factor EnvC (AmiA/AmiB activator)